MNTLRVFNHHIHAGLVWLATAHFLILVGSLLASLGFYRVVDAGANQVVSGFSLMFVMAVVYGFIALLCLAAIGIYRPHRESRYLAMFVRVVSALVFAAVLVFVIHYLFAGTPLNGQVVSLAVLLSLVGVGVSQAVFYSVIGLKLAPWRVMFYGAGRNAAELLSLMQRQRDHLLCELVGCAAVDDEITQVSSSLLCRVDCGLSEFALKHDIDEIVVVMDDWQRKLPSKELMDCRLAGISVVDALTFCERQTGQIQTELLSPEWLIFSPGFRKSGTKNFLKRMMDLLGSLVLLLVSWPIMILAALAIKIEDGPFAPVFYRQTRIGLNGREFSICKFRSMRIDAETASGPKWAQVNDTRVTRVGHYLRKLRIDELPQLWNVFEGDMSLVGPRPERPEFIEHLNQILPYYGVRETVKPGITGWAQLRYPYGASDEDAAAKLHLDLYYVKNRSLFFDLLILINTVEVVLFCKGSR